MRFRIISTAFIVLVLHVSSAVAQRSDHPHKVIRVTEEDAVNPNEVSIVINPINKNNIVASSMQYKRVNGRRLVTNFAYWSMDGGSTFNTVAHPNPDFRTQGDDGLTFDADGNVYHSFISFRGIRQQRPVNAVNGILVNKSVDGGKTWTSAIPAVDHINTAIPFEDKPWLVTDNTNSPYRGSLYLSWTRFDVYGSSSPRDSTHIYFSYSRDGGETFAQPFRISDIGGDAVDDDNTVEGAVPTVGPDGEVYVAWSGPRGIELDVSMDGGLTFGIDRVVTEQPGGWDIDVPGIGRANGMPVTKFDYSETETRGNLYINWIDNRNGDLDVFLIRSEDGGNSWSEPIRVNNDPLSNDKNQFFSWMAVDPVDGSINIAFYDRNGGNGSETSLTLARSTDGGRTFTNYFVNQPFFQTKSSTFFGDYIGVDAFDGRVAIAYQHFVEDDKLAISAAIFDF